MSLRSPAGALAIWLSTFAAPAARADAIIVDDPQPRSIQLASFAEQAVPDAVDPPASWAGAPGYPGAPAPHGGPNVYPRLNAPLYPSPVQHVPAWTGGTFITNQAFAPHEMTYPHRYHAMYPPFYYKVDGKWILTPCGMRQHEQWKLEGTEVTVNYRSRFRLFSGYHPPR